MDQKKTYICCKCNIELELKKTNLSYLGKDMATEILCCPKCGVPYIPESIVKDKMKRVEEMLEGK